MSSRQPTKNLIENKFLLHENVESQAELTNEIVLSKKITKKSGGKILNLIVCAVLL